MCRGLSPQSYLHVDGWTFGHATSPPAFIATAMLLAPFVPFASTNPVPWTALQVFTLHCAFTALHWTDEWLETHTHFGSEYAIGYVLLGDPPHCESETNWYMDSPADAMSGYLSSAVHIIAVAYGGVAASPRVVDRIVCAMFAIGAWLGSRPLALSIGGEVWSFVAIASFAAGLTCLQQIAASLFASAIRRNASRTSVRLGRPRGNTGARRSLATDSTPARLTLEPAASVTPGGPSEPSRPALPRRTRTTISIRV